VVVNFIFLSLYEKFGKFEQKLAKLIEFALEKTKISKNFPISLSKNNEIFPKKKTLVLVVTFHMSM
jgi:hypothetical protein